MIKSIEPFSSYQIPYQISNFESLTSELLVSIFKEVAAERHKDLALVCKRFRANTVLVPFLHLRSMVIEEQLNIPPFTYYAAFHKPLHFSLLLSDAVKKVRSDFLIRALHELCKQGHAQKVFSQIILNYHTFTYAIFEKFIIANSNHPLHEPLKTLKSITCIELNEPDAYDWSLLNATLKEFYIQVLPFVKYLTTKRKFGLMCQLNRFLQPIPPDALRIHPYVLFTKGLLDKGSIRELKRDGNYVDFLPNDIGFARCALIKNAEIFEVMPYSIRNNPEIVSLVAQRRWQSFRNATSAMKDQENIVLGAIRHNENTFFDASERLKTNRNFIFRAIAVNPLVYNKLRTEFQNDIEMCKAVLRQPNLEPDFEETVRKIWTRASKKKIPF